LNHCATKEYAVKPVSIVKDGDAYILYLIAVYHHNRISNTKGFVLYSATDIEKWSLREDAPFIDALLFISEDEAFIMGEAVLKMNLRSQLSVKTDHLPNQHPRAPQSA